MRPLLSQKTFIFAAIGIMCRENISPLILYAEFNQGSDKAEEPDDYMKYFFLLYMKLYIVASH